MLNRWRSRWVVALGASGLLGYGLVTFETIGSMPAGPRFTRVAMPGPSTDRASTGGINWVDVDSDGDVDLFVANGYDVSSSPAQPQPDRLYLNDGSGQLVGTESGPFDTVVFSSGSNWADVDNDGDLDVFIPSQRRVPGLLFRNLGNLRFERVLEQPPARDSLAAYASSWVDVDRDGNLDLLVYSGGLSSLATVSAYRGLGGGRFESMTVSPLTTDSAAFGGGVWADIDDDGDSDLFLPVMGMRGRLRHGLYRNEGGWNLVRWTSPELERDAGPAIAATWGDYDNDGDMDLFLGAERGLAGRLYRNDGQAGFHFVADAAPSLMPGGNQLHPLWADIDNDGDLDLLTVRWGASSTIYLNDGGGTFRVVEFGAHGDFDRLMTYKSGTATADYDGDGDLDVYVGNWPERPGPGEENLLLRNESPPSGWVMVRLEGTRSNRSAIGSRLFVTATIGGRTVRQRREVHTQQTWRSQSDLVQHFGLGNARRVDSLQIRWPSGVEELCTGIVARSRVHVVEGKGWRLESAGNGSFQPCPVVATR